LTIGRLDFILAILQLILYVCSWYESDPPVNMQWLLDTDWGYLLDISRQSAVKVKKHSLAICCTLALVLSILLFITETIWLVRSDQDNIAVTLNFECFVVATFFTNVLIMAYGADQLGENVHKRVFVGISTQLAILVARIAVVSTTKTLWSRFIPLLLNLVGCLILLAFIEVSAAPFRRAQKVLGLLPCVLLLHYASVIMFYAKDISANGGDPFNISILTIETIVTAEFVIGLIRRVASFLHSS